MRFLIDAMFPSSVVEYLAKAGHVAVNPRLLGAQDLSDDALVDIATAEGMVIVTENAVDFAHVATCPVVFVRKSWWPSRSLATGLADALSRWAEANAQPGPWPHWLDGEFR